MKIPPAHNGLREKKKEKFESTKVLFYYILLLRCLAFSLTNGGLSFQRSLCCRQHRVALPLQREFQRILQSDWERAYPSVLAGSDSNREASEGLSQELPNPRKMVRLVSSLFCFPFYRLMISIYQCHL